MLDSRVISRWHLVIADHHLQPLRSFAEEPFAGVFVARAVHAGTSGPEPTTVVERRRYIGFGMREDLAITNHGPDDLRLVVQLRVAADFADLFAVKRGQPVAPGTVTTEADGQSWRGRLEFGGQRREVTVSGEGAVATASGLRFEVPLARGGRWSTQLQVEVVVDGKVLPARFPAGLPIEAAEPTQRAAAWRSERHRVTSGSAVLVSVFERSQRDLAALRIVGDAAADVNVLAAGAPWFMALFGRDSLISGWMTLCLDPGVALGTLRTLARYQGKVDDPETEEQPGRIIHELRLGTDESLALGGAQRYYGSADATPLFVMVLGSALRWGVDRDEVAALLPAADAALEWLERRGDLDGDGFVEYRTTSSRGLRNQGWKDSDDGINFADGRLAEPPIALVEVQAYVYAAYRARAYLASVLEGADSAGEWRQRAERFGKRFNEAFWIESRGRMALGLDADKRPIDAVTSNVGHALWAGAVAASHAPAVAAQLCSPAMFTGYGIRTLADDMGAYNPVSYHNGSVWPHDTALCIAGLNRYGFRVEAERIASGLIDAASTFGGRLPEVFCGFSRAGFPGPVPYPTSCSPQAWASAAPVAVLTSLLGIRPDGPASSISADPALPEGWRPLRFAGIPLGHGHVAVSVAADGSAITEVSDGLRVVPAAVGADAHEW